MKQAFLVLAGLVLCAPVFAAPQLQDKAQLQASLKAAPPCCVIDARSAAPRALHPIKDALIWRKGLRINPTSAVVVIGDDDKGALSVGRAIEKSSGAKQVLAVKGGVATWRSLIEPESGMPATFVIPKNTCESGVPLQTLRSGKP